MADRVDLRTIAWLSHERIVFGNSSVIVESENLSGIIHRILRPLQITMMRGAHEERAIRSEDNARRISAGERHPRFGNKDLLHIKEGLAVKASARERRRVDLRGPASASSASGRGSLPRLSGRGWCRWRPWRRL